MILFYLNKINFKLERYKHNIFHDYLEWDDAVDIFCTFCTKNLFRGRLIRKIQISTTGV